MPSLLHHCPIRAIAAFTLARFTKGPDNTGARKSATKGGSVAIARLHQHGQLTGLMVCEFEVPSTSQRAADRPQTWDSLFLVCWNGVWCSPQTHSTAEAACDELKVLERDAMYASTLATSSMAFPPWHKQCPWRRIRPLLHIAGVLTVPRIPGQRTRAEFAKAQEAFQRTPKTQRHRPRSIHRVASPFPRTYP